jgi:hypothetical protein
MDIDKTADEAAGRVLDQIERDGTIHRSSIARVIADEMHRANRVPYHSHMTIDPSRFPSAEEMMCRLRDAIIRKHDPG